MDMSKLNETFGKVLSKFDLKHHILKHHIFNTTVMLIMMVLALDNILFVLLTIGQFM